MKEELRILLADDHRIVRDGLRALFEKEPGMAVVAEADNGRTAVKLANQHRPDVVVIDVTMPELNGVEATRRILADLPETRVIALSIHSNPRFVDELLKAGAVGYLLKDSAFEELLVAVRTVLDKGFYLSPEVTGVVIGTLKQGVPGDGKPAMALLSGRELEILQLFAEGFSTKQIADRLNISVKTVATHRHHIMTKLGLGSVAELTKYAIREGITSLDL